jgi:two-component system cell cycle response regulator DivK
MNKKVLLVENDGDTREIYAAALEHNGYRVLLAKDGCEGLRVAQENEPDIILMNLAMPKIDGLSATCLLRDDPRTAAIPIVACTGFAYEDGAERAESAGADAYLEKPVEPTRLVREVERIIGPAVPAGR